MEQVRENLVIRNAKPVIGGILSIVSAGLTLTFIINNFVTWNSEIGSFFQVYGSVTTLYIIACILAIIGGILAMKRTAWPLALVGVAIPILLWPYLMGVIALILVAVSRKQFR